MRKYFRNTLVLILTLLGFWACEDKPEINEFRTKLLEEVNLLRMQGCLCGEDTMPAVQEVFWDDALEIAAVRHVTDMSQNNHLDHVGTDDSTPPQRAEDAGFEGVFIGENIARGYITISDVMNQWKSSTAHCKAMMDGRFYFMAVAYEDYYWVQLFGSN